MEGTLSQIIEGYLELRWRADPVEATRIGRHEHDGAWADWSAESIRAHVAALRSYTLALEEVDARTIDEEIDRTAALHSARHELQVLEKERPFARDPSMHVGHALSGIYLLIARMSADPHARAAALVARLSSLPEFLERATEIVDAPALIHVQTARDMLAGSMSLIQDGLDDPELDLTGVEPDELQHAREAALQALQGFGDSLVLMAEHATEDFALGRDLFDEKLHTSHMIPDSASALARYGESLRAEAIEQLERAAEEIEPGASWRDVLRRVSADMAPRGEAIEAYAGALRSVAAVVRDRDLVSFPDAPLTIRPTPEFLRVLMPFAAYMPAGAFDADQTGVFFVTLAPEEAPWRTHARGELLSIVAHEVIPGHHLHIASLNKLDSTVRRSLMSALTLEGWALYCESLLSEQGLLDEDPVARLHLAHHLLWRALRVRLDVGLHTGGVSPDEAIATLETELGLDNASATAEVRRYCAYPTYQLCYAVGRRDILKLRDDAKQAWGTDFTLARFHAELMRYGALPLAMARWGMKL